MGYSVQSISSVTQSRLTLWPHESQHVRPPCPSPTPGTCSNSCPWSRWCHPNISSSVIPFSLLPSTFPSIRVFSNELALGIRCQSTGASASASVLPVNTQGWFPLGRTGWISWQPKTALGLTKGTACSQVASFVGLLFSLPSGFLSHCSLWRAATKGWSVLAGPVRGSSHLQPFPLHRIISFSFLRRVRPCPSLIHKLASESSCQSPLFSKEKMWAVSPQASPPK